MIDPKLLTKENGFEDGVAVEIDEHSLGWWSVDQFNSFGVEYLGFATVHGSIMREFQSIKPLTGPMSIWNHSPDYAVAMSIFTEDSVTWLRMIPNNWEWSHVTTHRPFWAKVTE